MFFSLIYLLSIISLFYGFIRIKKTNKEINFIFTLFISFILFFCYNSIIGYILNIFYIPINLISLSIINFIISILLFIKSKKEKQKYKIEKIDIIASIILFIVTLLIGLFRFGFPINVIYETSDPGVHFWTSLDFYRNSSLLNHVVDPVVDFSTRQFSSYLNLGILFQMFEPFVGEVRLCEVYVLFDVFMLLMSSIIFYILIRLLCKKLNKAIIIGASIFYVIGYPLNNMIFGFFYSGHAIIIINLVLILMYVYKNKLLDEKQTLFYLSLTNIGLFFTYYFYAPVVFGTIFIVFLLENIINKKKILNKDFSLKVLSTLVLPCILGMIYFIIPNIGNEDMNFIKQIQLDGYFYNDIISNFILFIPIVIYYILDCIKKKKFDFESLLLIVLITFMLFITILIFLDKAVFYYLSKNYYVLWLLMFVIVLKFLNDLPKKNNNIGKIYISLYCILAISSIFNLETIMIQKNDYFVNKRLSSNILDVYYYNVDKMNRKEEILTSEEINMLDGISKFNPADVITNSQILYQRIWVNALFKKEKIDYPENQLYTYIVEEEYYYEPIGINTFNTLSSKYNYYLVFFRHINTEYNGYSTLDISPDTYFKINIDDRNGRYVDWSANYYMIDRKTCSNCQFYDYKAGMLIIR